MRTTLTIDDAIAASLKKISHQTGKPFKQIVNETLLAGLSRPEQTAPKPYTLKPMAMGAPAPGFNLEKALLLADELENQAVIQKMEQRK
ncbi:MAG: hypothetical protein R3F02_10485 [Thiolinea sp.]